MVKNIKQSLPKQSPQQPPPSKAVTLAAFSGPIPPPDILAKYDTLQPGLADRIVTMAESEVKHRHEMEKVALHLESSERKRGQHYGLVMGILCLATSIGAILLGAETAGAVIGGTTIVGLVSAFVAGRLIKPKE